MPQSPHHLQNDLKCVEWDVKPCSINQSILNAPQTLLMVIIELFMYTLADYGKHVA